MPVPARKATRLGIFLADFANNGYGQRRLQLDPAAIHDPGEQACETTRD